MFRTRQKKIFPPGTFIATPARMAAIIQLCFAFSLLLWIISQPFMGDLFAVKSERLLSQELIGKTALMELLPASEQESIKLYDEKLQQKLQHSFLEKFKASMQLLFIQTAPFKQAWLLFSFLLPLFLLLRIEGAIQACWLLPILTLAYAVDNQFNAQLPKKNPDTYLFPSESVLIQNHLRAPLSNSISKQQKQLTEGWKNYLISEWAKEGISSDLSLYEEQVEKGEFAFNVARLKTRSLFGLLAMEKGPERQSLAILGLYLAWNSLFAWLARKAIIIGHPDGTLLTTNLSR
ncbi:MAG: hypothetical protein H0T62_14600 [Parachlamydiaceae bacterium]|nr:hypothetical protein [Parachlamydiaceae bacterium]